MEKTITLTEGQLNKLVKESVVNILNEGFFESFFEGKKKDDDEPKKDKKKKDEDKPKKGKRGSGLAAQAKQRLGDEKINNAEIARQLEDLGFLSGDEDTDRSYVSKMKRGERPMPPGVPAGIINIMSGDN